MSNLGIALVHYVCPVCGKPMDETILMNSILTENHANNIESLNGKAIGYSDHVCDECAKYASEAIFIIAINEAKLNKEPYRTGKIVGIKKTSKLAEQLQAYVITLKDNSMYCFMDEKVGKSLGLWE